MGSIISAGPVTVFTIGGDPASGKSTVASLLAQATGFRRIYAGGILRSWSQDPAYNPNNIPFEQWYATLDKSVDNKVDEYLRIAALQDDKLVLEGRMAFHWPAPGKRKLSVYIRVDPAEAARRVYEQKKNTTARKEEQAYASVDEAKDALQKRKEVERQRYLQLYNVDIHDINLYNTTLDSTRMKAEDITDILLRVSEPNTAP